MQHTSEEFTGILDTRGKIMTTVTVVVVLEHGLKALDGEFTWLIIRKKVQPKT